MLTNFISEAVNTNYRPAFGSIEKGPSESKRDPSIRINVRRPAVEFPPTDFYDRARKIYSRARTSGSLSIAAGIF